MHTRTHPLTGEPLEPIGFIGGRPVWPIMGASEPAPEGAPPAAASPAAGGGAPPAGSTPAAGGQPAAGAAPLDTPIPDDDPDAGDVERLAAKYTPKQLAAYTLRLRNEAGDARQAGKAAADAARQEALGQLKPFLVQLGVMKDDDPADPAAIAKQLEDEKAARAEVEKAARADRLELEVLRASTDPGLVQAVGQLDVARLLDSRRFTDTLAALDPAAKDLRGKVVAAMKEAAEKDASLKATRVVARAGVPLTGGSGEPARSTAPMSLEDGVASHYR